MCGGMGVWGCKMFTKVLYNIENNGGEGGAIFEPKTHSRYKKK